MSIIIKTLRFIVLLAVAAGGLSVQADESARLSATMEGALDVMYLPKYQDYTAVEQQRSVRELLEVHYDLEVLVRRAMARNWNLLSAEEQIRVSDLINQLIVKSFVEGMQGRERPIVHCGDVIEVTSKRIEVPVTIRFPEAPAINVLYRLGRSKSGWQIYDIVAEEISIVSNYRQQFDDHFRKKNGAQLIEQLESLLKKEHLDVSTKI